MLRRILLLAGTLVPSASALCAARRSESTPYSAFDLEPRRDGAEGTADRCGALATYDDFQEWSQRRYEAEREMARAGNESIMYNLIPRDDIVIDTVVTVIASSDRPEDGYISDEQIARQIAALNEGYSGTGFRFRHTLTGKIINPDWALRGRGAEAEFKPRYRKGTWQTLNLYIMTRYQDGKDNPGGHCQNPTNDPRAAADRGGALALDGCIIHHKTLPGGGARHAHGSMDRGKTAVHEVGHWLGLFHTFENFGDPNKGGCEPGDLVADTPAQAIATWECKPRDTCPDSAGVDFYTNFMDYTSDDCMDFFTNGQKDRMHRTWKTFREGQ